MKKNICFFLFIHQIKKQIYSLTTVSSTFLQCLFLFWILFSCVLAFLCLITVLIQHEWIFLMVLLSVYVVMYLFYVSVFSTFSNQTKQIIHKFSLVLTVFIMAYLLNRLRFQNKKVTIVCISMLLFLLFFQIVMSLFLYKKFIFLTTIEHISKQTTSLFSQDPVNLSGTYYEYDIGGTIWTQKQELMNFWIVGQVWPQKSAQDFVGWFQVSKSRFCVLLMDGHHEIPYNARDIHQIALKLYANIQRYTQVLENITSKDDFRQFIISWYKHEIIEKRDVDTEVSFIGYWGVCLDIVLVTSSTTFLFHHVDTRVYLKFKNNDEIVVLPEYKWTNDKLFWSEYDRLPESDQDKVKARKYKGRWTSRSIGDFDAIERTFDETNGTNFFPVKHLDIQTYKNLNIDCILLTSDGLQEHLAFNSYQFNEFRQTVVTPLIQGDTASHLQTFYKTIRIPSDPTQRDDVSYVCIEFPKS